MDTIQKQLVEIFHTIFCCRTHELDMEQFEMSDSCCYYLEQAIEDTWEQKAHKIWTEQVEFFEQISKADTTDILQQFVKIHKIVIELKQASPLYISYINILLGEEK